MIFRYLVDYNPITRLIEYVVKSSQLTSDLVEYFAKLICRNCPQNVSKWLFGMGVLSVTCSTLGFLYKKYKEWGWAIDHIQNARTVSKQSLVSRYGDGWVVVTGCTDGIGWAFCELLAPMFNLVLVARNEKKLNKRVNELKIINPNIAVKTILADLSKLEDINRTVDSIEQLIARKEIDINMVINNAGMVERGGFFGIQQKNMQELIRLNIQAVYEMNKRIIPLLRSRPQRSAIINLSSCTGIYTGPYYGVYSSSKHFIDIYSRALSQEQRDKIDIISIRPFGVTTTMYRMKKNYYAITPADCAFSSLADLGKVDQSFGGSRHKELGGKLRFYQPSAINQFYAERYRNL